MCDRAIRDLHSRRLSESMKGSHGLKTRDTVRAPMSAEPAHDIVLVDEHDRPVGTSDKLAAHQRGGVLHRAFSVFLFDAQGRMLLQQRAATKYHFANLWTNACCSHPRPGEAVAEAARRRVREELGIDVPLTPALTFVYRAEDPASGLTEHEYDHVFVGRLDGEPAPNPAEVSAVEWIDPAALLRDVRARPERYTPWFRIVLDRVLNHHAE
jgi:isopentenyl-diphosphate delta-isomerase